jgi:hypothetical protein
MDHRLEITGPARITVLGKEHRQLRGRAANGSGEGLRLILDEPVAPGSPLAVEWEDTEVMGEVCYCEQIEDGFAAGVRLEHALRHTGEIARLARKLLGEPTG